MTRKERHPHEERFVRAFNRLGPDAYFAEEHLVHRKSRRADLVHVYQDTPREFGVLQPWLDHRMVAYEHYADVANTAALYQGLETLYALGRRRLRAPADRRGAFEHALADAQRPPLVVVLCRRMVREPMVLLTQILPGMWTTHPYEDHAELQMLVVEADRLPDQPGTGLLRWLPLPRTDEERLRRVAALRDDPCLATVLGDLLLEDIMNENIPTGPGEPEEVRGYLTTLQQLRKELAAAAADKAAAVAAARALRTEFGDHLTPEAERLLQTLERGPDGATE